MTQRTPLVRSGSKHIEVVAFLACRLLQDPSVDITKTFVYAPSREDGFALVDETIVYTITASNDGNVDLSSLAVTAERFLNSEGEARSQDDARSTSNMSQIGLKVASSFDTAMGR